MDTVDEAARRTAINLMRLSEALDIKDAEGYSQAMVPSGTQSYRRNRINNIRDAYRQWFTNVAGSAHKGSPDKGTIGSNRGGPAMTKGEN